MCRKWKEQKSLLGLPYRERSTGKVKKNKVSIKERLLGPRALVAFDNLIKSPFITYNTVFFPLSDWLHIEEITSEPSVLTFTQ